MLAEKIAKDEESEDERLAMLHEANKISPTTTTTTNNIGTPIAKTEFPTGSLVQISGIHLDPEKYENV